MSLLGLGAGRGFDGSTFFPQSLGGVTACLVAPVLLQSFLADSVPDSPRFSVEGAGLSHFLAGTVCALAVERGTSPFGAGAGDGVDTVA